MLINSIKKETILLHKLKLLIAGLFVLFFINISNAQINTNKIKVDLSSLSFKACNDTSNGLSTVTIESKQATTTDFQIAFNFPVGVYYQIGTGVITVQTGSNDFVLTEFDVSNLNQPIFRIERPSNAAWQINDKVIFTYEKTADCDAVNYSYNGGLFKDRHTVTFNDSQGGQTASDNNPSINSYNLLRAFLAVDDIQSVSDNIGGQQTRNIVIRNSGNGSVQRFEHQVQVSTYLQPNYELSFNGTVLSPNVSGNIYTYTIDLNLAPFAGQVGNGNNLFENESISLLERMTISQCSWDEATVHSPRWGCAPGNYCQLGSPISGAFIYEQEWAMLELSPINNPLPRWDAPVTYTYQVSNDITANNAYNVNINLGYTWDGDFSTTGFNPFYGDDNNTNRQLSNFQIGASGVITPQRWQNTDDPAGTGLGSYLIPADFLTSDPDGVGGLEDLDGDGFYDDLAPGSSTTISFNLTIQPNSPICSEYGNVYLANESLRMDLWSVTSCNNPTETNREIINSSSVRREALFNWRDPKSYDQDAEDGQIFNLNFVGSFLAKTESPTCNGNKMLTNAPNTIYTATVTLPNGISLDSSADSRYSQSGSQVIFTETNLANFVRDGAILEIPINFPLIVDCATYSGPEYLELDYTTNYSSSCYSEQLHCGTFGVTVHCPTLCNGPTTTSFDANRVTAGWTDDTMATKVTLDPNSYATKYYMAKDEMVVTTSAVMNNDIKDNLFLEMRYVTDEGVNMSDIIAFESGTISINDLSSGTQTTIINVMPTVNTFGTNDNRMTFDLSSYRSVISPTYQYGEGLQADEIELELHFRFKDDFPEEGRFYQFYSFSGEFYGLDSSNNKIGCDIYNERAFFFENKIQLFEVGENDFVKGCDEKYISVGLMQSTNFGDKFPNEFRPPLVLNSATIEIPQGMVFENVVSSFDYPNLQPEDEEPGSWNNGFNYTVSGNIVTITPGSRFRHLDQGDSNFPHINIRVRATSATPALSDFDVTANYQEYAYSDNPVSKIETYNQIFNHFTEEFYIDNFAPVVIGNSELASFTVQIGNGSVAAIDYNWLRVDAGTGYHLTDAYLVVGGTETPLNLINDSGIYYIEFGDMPANVVDTKTIRFEGTFDECVVQGIKVSQNYDCIGYPSSYNGLPYFNEQTYTLQPVPSALQLNILNQPNSTVDTCSDYNVILEARNAGEGDLGSPVITFDIPGDISSITIVDIAVEYPRNSGNIESIVPTISGNTVTLDLLQHTFINAKNSISGSFGASSLDDQIAIINMTLNPQCNYRSNTGTEYIISGNSPCGTPAVGSGSRIASEPIIITGAEPPYSTNTIVLNSPNLSGCDIETVSVETYIVDGNTGSNDYSRIVFPAGLNYITNSFISTGTVSATFIAVNIVGDHQEIEISLPSGATPSDIIAYNFEVESTAIICAGSYDIQFGTYVTVSGLSCNSVSCGTTEVVTGEAIGTVSITKGVIGQSSYTASAAYINGGSSTDYQVSFGLENTGTEDLATGMVYNVFCANGSGIKVGPSIYTGTLTQSIPVGISIEESISFSSTNFCGTNSNLIIEFEPSNSNCFCEGLSVLIASQVATLAGSVTFVNDNITVNEAEGSATLEVIFNGNFPGGFTLDFESLVNTALAPEDFILNNGTLTFNGTDGEIQRITILINDDDILESLENFTVNLMNPSSVSIAIIDENATVNIISIETDTDNDNIADIVDLDDDNDGILDSNEAIECVDDDYLEWGFNNPTGTVTNDFVQNPAITDWLFTTISNISAGSGLTTTSPGKELQVSSVNSLSYFDAVLQDEYMEVNFSTGSGLVDPIINRIGVNWFQDTNGTKIGRSYDVAIAISEDNFLTSTLLNTNIRVHYPTNGISEFFDLTNTAVTYKLTESTSYTIRAYIYNQQNDGTEAYSVFDDFTIRVSSCLEQNSDSDSLPDHLDPDSDDDGCVDAIEAGHLDNDNDGFLGNSPVVVDLNGLVTGQGGYTGTNNLVITPRAIVNYALQPNQAVTLGSNVTLNSNVVFDVVAPNTAPIGTYKWQISTDFGINWSDLSNGGIYSGADSEDLTISNIPLEIDDYQYRLRVINPTDNCTPETITGASIITLEKADLSIDKRLATGSSNTPNVGDTLTFEIELENIGPDNATNIVIEDVIPIGFSVVTGSISNNGILTGNTITWNIAALPAGNLVLTYNVTVNIPTSIANEYVNIAQVVAVDQYDPDSTPNNDDGDQSEDDEDAVRDIFIDRSDLSIDKHLAIGSTNTPNVGDTLTFEIDLQNNGPDNATNIIIEDVIPIGFSVVTGSISNNGILTGNTITWNIAALPAGNLVLNYNVTVNVPTGIANEYVNIAQVIAVDQYDPDSTPNNDDGDQSEDDEDAVRDIFIDRSDLSIDKHLATGSTNTPNVGDTLTFEIDLQNNGPDNATNIIIEDVIPIGFSVVTGSISNGGILSGNTITWNIAALPAGNLVLNYNVTVNVPTGIANEYVNIAQVIAVDQYDPDSTPNNDDGDQSEDDEDAVNTISVLEYVDINISKVSDIYSADIGDEVIFTISAENIGNTAATNISIEENIPNGFEYVSHTATNGSYDNLLGEWLIDTINPNESVVLYITVVMIQGDNYTNVASLSYLDQLDNNMNNDQDEVTIDLIIDENCLVVYNEFSPNNDGANEVFYIDCIDQYPNNTVQVFNRWGAKVFEMQGYANTWDGTSQGRATVNANEKLPVGTYFYTLDLGDGVTKPKSGWLYITR